MVEFLSRMTLETTAQYYNSQQRSPIKVNMFLTVANLNYFVFLYLH